jgi:subtilisin family serine protease
MKGHRFRGQATLLTCWLIALMGVFIVCGEVHGMDVNAGKVVGAGGYPSLVSKAGNEGSVRILVRLQTPFTVEPLLTETHALKQRLSIAETQDRLVAELKGAGKRPRDLYKFKYTPYLAMAADGETIEALLASPVVVKVQEDVPAEPTLDWSISKIDASSLQGEGVVGTGVTVAVLDTGVDKNHPFLKGSVVSEGCYSTTDEGKEMTSLCPGRVGESIKSGSAMPYSGVCPETKCDHGTHVAGIATGRAGASGSQGPGTAPKANIIAIQVFSRYDADASCKGRPPCVLTRVTDQMKGLERVYALKDTYSIAAVNMSLGGGEYTENCDDDSRKPIIDTLRAAGIATIASSGNSGYCGAMGTPACISSAVSVGSTDSEDEVAGSSNSASFMSLLAPGVDILSSVPYGKYAYKSGTSMAAPHMTGAWALIRQGHPTATVTQILDAFTRTGEAVTDSGKCPTVTKQRINVNDAYKNLSPTATVEINMEGRKKGTVTAGDKTCSASPCAWLYGPGTPVALTAHPSGTAYLDEWVGCDSVAGMVCNVTATGTKQVTAVFNPPPNIYVSPLALNFGTVKIGTSPYKSIVIRNTGVSALTLNSIVPRGMDPSFSIDSTECGTLLAKGQMCRVYVTFTPDATDLVSGFIDISSDDPDRPLVPVTLKGKGR